MRLYPIGVPQEWKEKKIIDVYNWTTDFIFGDDLEREMRCVCVSGSRAARRKNQNFRTGRPFSCLDSGWLLQPIQGFCVDCLVREEAPRLGVFIDQWPYAEMGKAAESFSFSFPFS